MPGRTWWPEKAAGTAATGALDTVARTAATAATTKPGSVDLEPSRILPVAGNAGRKCVSAALDLLGNAVSAAGGAGAGRERGGREPGRGGRVRQRRSPLVAALSSPPRAGRRARHHVASGGPTSRGWASGAGGVYPGSGRRRRTRTECGTSGGLVRAPGAEARAERAGARGPCCAGMYEPVIELGVTPRRPRFTGAFNQIPNGREAADTEIVKD